MSLISQNAKVILKNPMIVTGKKAHQKVTIDDRLALQGRIVKEAKEKGYDGIIVLEDVVDNC